MVNVVTLALGSRPRQKACKGAGQDWAWELHSHAPGSAKECEGKNPRTPKWTPMLGIGVSVDSWMFREWFTKVKTQWLKESFIPLESYWNVDV
jgi:hypothetical protein